MLVEFSVIVIVFVGRAKQCMHTRGKLQALTKSIITRKGKQLRKLGLGSLCSLQKKLGIYKVYSFKSKKHIQS